MERKRSERKMHRGNRPKNRQAYEKRHTENSQIRPSEKTSGRTAESPGSRTAENPAGRPTPVTPIREHTRTGVKAALAGLFLAASGVVYFYSRPEGKAPEQTPQTQTAEADPVTKDTLIVDLTAPQKKLPEIRLADVAANFEPEQFVPPLSPAEMAEISKKIAEFARGYFLKNTIPALKEANEDIEKTRRVSSDFIKAILQYAVSLDPKVGQPLANISPETPPETKRKIFWVFINNFLLRQNLMLTEQRPYSGSHAFYNLSPVEKFRNAVITDTETGGKTLAPIFYLRDSLLPQAEITPRFRNVSMQYDPETGIIFWRNGELARMLKQPAIIEEIRRYLPGYPSAAELSVENDYAPVLKHEGAHKYLAGKYPQDLSRQIDARDYVDAAVKLGGGKTLRIKGLFHPVTFHELAATGMELASTTEKDLLVARSLLHSKFSKEAPETYALIRAFLKKAFEGSGTGPSIDPDSPANPDPEDDPEKNALNAPIETINAAGGRMYNLGLALLANRKKVK